MVRKEINFILGSFVLWRVLVFAFLFLAIKFIPLQRNFLGGGLSNYLSAPWFWSWANFDGEHYLSIAQHGYGFAEQAFFPLYPALIGVMGRIFGNNLSTLNFFGLLISNASFLMTMIGLYKLIRLDFSEKIAKLVIITLLLFPTSFFFGSVYTESLFLALVLWSFYLARGGNWFSSSILGALASGTRTIGIILFPAFLIEWYFQKNRKTTDILFLLLIPVGLLVYMIYLKQTTGGFLVFLHALPSFGEQRSATPILLPQVFYRYFFKILPSLNYSYFPSVFTTILETIVGVIFLLISIWSFFKLRLSYAIYLSLGYLVPTLSGSFSSLPRYVLVLFPAFILFAVFLSRARPFLKFVTLGISFVILAVSTMVFLRGFWIA